MAGNDGRESEQAAAAPVDQTALTVVAEVNPQALDALRADLEAMGAPRANAAETFPFAQLPSVHFGRFVLLEPAADLEGHPLPAALVFAVDFDGPLDPFLCQLTASAGPWLDRIFGRCAGYSTAGGDAARIAYLRGHAVKAGTTYVNWIGRTVGQIRREGQLREQIEAFLDRSKNELGGAGPAQVRSAIQRFVEAEASLAWARSPLPPMSVAWRARRAAEVGALALAALVLAPFVALAAPFYLLALRAHERSDVPSTEKPDVATRQRLAALEDHVVQNPFSAVGHLKPGAFRRMTLTLVLFVLNLATRHVFNRGNLSGVKTLHFARWVFLNDKRRLIFASSYDGSLESYMDDFIDKASWGLNATFGNGQGYPRTRWLILDGARQEQAFKDFLHTHQIPTQVWYSAYPGLTALNISRNAQIRAGLYGDMGDRDAAQWLSLL